VPRVKETKVCSRGTAAGGGCSIYYSPTKPPQAPRQRCLTGFNHAPPAAVSANHPSRSFAPNRTKRRARRVGAAFKNAVRTATAGSGQFEWVRSESEEAKSISDERRRGLTGVRELGGGDFDAGCRTFGKLTTAGVQQVTQRNAVLAATGQHPYSAFLCSSRLH
jgi:hypothetical protein